MTTQEAIKYIFEFLKASDFQAPASEVFKAGIAIGTIQKAIEAKEQEICEDAIRRKAVFEAIDDCNSDGLKGIFCSYDDGKKFKEYIKELPSVTPISKECIDCIAEDKTFLKMDRIKQLLNSDKLDDCEVLKKISEVIND